MKNEVLKFKSKRNWIVFIVYALFIAAITLLWAIPYKGELVIRIISTCMLGIILGVFTWAVFSTYYLLADDYLICVSGPFRTRVFYTSITEIKPSRSCWSALALSTDRVAIMRGKNVLTTTFVSPQFKEFFIKELQKRVDEKKQTKNLKVENE
jgi:hypothetical protein